MADRVAALCGDSRRKRKDRSPSSVMQQRQDAKTAAMIGKVARTDTETVDEQFTTATQDSVQTAFGSCHAAHQHHHHQEDADVGSSGSEVDGPLNDKYIKGTRLVIGGWFQACRGCNEPTAHSAPICRREVPLCPRCQGKYNAMVSGSAPPTNAMVDANVEPLHYWLPRLLPAVPRLTAEQRREFCDMLVLRQDDAWLALIQMS